MKSRLLILSLVVVVSCNLALSRFAEAQLTDRNLPSQSYYLGIPALYAGDYEDALRHFERGASGGFKFGQERFMDSACYWTMAGECHYHLGNYGQALQYYEQTIELLNYYSQGDWIDRILREQLQQVQRNDSADQVARINWHRSNRGQSVARVPSSFTMMFGRLDANRVITEGGTFQPAELRGVDHAEIMRCCALAIYRRYMIKGVTSHIDPLTTKLIAGVNRIPSGVPIIGKWNLMLRGMANMSAGRTARAVSNIRDALQYDAGLDHTLTPIGLLSLAQIAYMEGDVNNASALALEASYSAALFNQYDLIEESLSLGTRIHLSENRSVYPPLTPAIAWAGSTKARLMQTSLLTRLADCLIETDDMAEAAQTLKQARKSMSRTDLNRGTLPAQIMYLEAAIKFFETGDGFADLKRALSQYQKNSRWIFQLSLIPASFNAGTISSKQAESMYSLMLLDPSVKQWMDNPLETMTYLSTPHVAPMQQWFELLLARKNHDKAIEVAEVIRRHRFYESLPLSGRLLSLRWLLTAPEHVLSPTALAQRSSFYNRYPQMKDSVEKIDNLIARLRQMPLKPDEDSPESKAQRDLFVEMLNAAKFQENAIAGVALRRQPADFAFPGIIDKSQLTDSLKDHQIVITSLQTESGYYQYAITKQTRRYLGVVRNRDMRRAVAEIFKKLGINDAVNAMDVATLSSTEWKEASLKLKKLLFANLDDDQWSNYKEAIIVPDGVLWYVPFEILQIGDDVADSKNLNDIIKLRYLPMASMIANGTNQSPDNSRLAVVTGKYHPKAELSLTQRGFEELSDSILNAQRYDRAVKIPSNLTNTVTDTMVVWQDLKTAAKEGPYSLSPFYADKGRPGSSLGEWLGAPWKGPHRIVLPAFNSNGAAGLKSKSDGSDLFYTTTALMASGVRNILISRWNAGGKNSLDLSRMFVTESQNMSTIEALESAMRNARNREIKFEEEIRVKEPRKDPKPFKAEHPFFWAGNMLVDLQGFDPVDDTDAKADVADVDTEDDKKTDDADSGDDAEGDKEDQPNEDAKDDDQKTEEGAATAPKSTPSESSDDKKEEVGENQQEQGSGSKSG